MNPVFLNSREQFGFNELYQNLIQICNQHKTDKRALAFAFILYDFTNEAIREVFQSEEKWMALHELSGKYLTVFSIHSKPRQRVRVKSSGPPMIKYLTSISSYQSPAESEKLLLDAYFNKEVKFPALLFFQVDEENVIDSVIIELNEKGAENIYYEMKEYIASAVAALKKIDPSITNNQKEIFRELFGNVNQTQLKRGLKAKFPIVTSLAKFILKIKSAGAMH